MDLESALASVEAALHDGVARLSTDIGGHQEVTQARLWRGQVLVEWESDPLAGGCLLRPDLLRRLLTLDARFSGTETSLVVRASGRVVAALSPHHADLVRRLGGPRKIDLVAKLAFERGQYRGGEETYLVVERGHRVPLLRVRVEVRLRSPLGASPRTSPAPT
jgi:hypothetical protein